MIKQQKVVQKIEEEEGQVVPKQGQYIVQGIRSKKIIKGEVKYLIKWAGYKQSENTWEPLTNLEGIHDLIIQFQQQEKESKNKSNKKLSKVKNEEDLDNSMLKKKMSQLDISKADNSVSGRQNKKKITDLQEELNIKLKKKVKKDSNAEAKDTKKSKKQKLNEDLKKSISQKMDSKINTKVDSKINSKMDQEPPKFQNFYAERVKQDQQKKKKQQSRIIQESSIKKVEEQQVKQPEQKQQLEAKLNAINQKLKSIDNIIVQSKNKNQNQYQVQGVSIGTNTEYKLFPGVISYRVNNIHKRQVKNSDGTVFEKIFVEAQLMNYKDQWLRSPQIIPIEQFHDMTPIILVRYFENLYRELQQPTQVN